MLEQRWEIGLRSTEDDDFGEKIIFSGAARSDLGGYVNKQNCRIWSTENTHVYIEKPTHPKRFIVWYRFGPFFFQSVQAVAVTVNGDRYRAMLNEFLPTKIDEEDIGNIRFPQDGAMCHMAKATLDVLRPVFEDRIISRRADVVWLTQSCDLTPLEYYLYGDVKLLRRQTRDN